MDEIKQQEDVEYFSMLGQPKGILTGNLSNMIQEAKFISRHTVQDAGPSGRAV